MYLHKLFEVADKILYIKAHKHVYVISICHKYIANVIDTDSVLSLSFLVVKRQFSFLLVLPQTTHMISSEE